MSSEPSDPLDADPFGSTTGASGYVARPACEQALDEMLAAVRRGAPSIALIGPNGIGKTQLIRVLAERLEQEAEILLLPYAAVEFPDLCHWVLGLLGEEQGPFSDPGGALLEAAGRRTAAGRRLILALDDASGLPIETARELAALVGQAGGELQLMVIPVDDPRAGRVLAALGSGLAMVRFNTPMSAEETAAYVQERLRASGIGADVQDRFTDPVLAWLHRESGGLPRELHVLAVQFLRDRPEADRDRFARREQWLELDGAEDEPEPTSDVPEAELRGAEEDEPIAARTPEPELAPPPKKAPQAPQRIPLPSRAEAPGWLRSHLPLLAGIGLFGVGVFFGLRASAPTQAPEQPPSVPVVRERLVEPVGEAAQEEEVPPDLEREARERAERMGSMTPSAEEPLDIEEPDATEADVVALPPSVAELPADELVEPPAEASADVSDKPAEPATTPEPVSEPEPTPELATVEVATPEPPPSAAEPQAPPVVPAPPATPLPGSEPVPLPVAANGPPVTIRVDSVPPARVFIDGRDRGRTPLGAVTLASGRHRFELIFPDGHHLLREKLIDDRHREIRFSQ